MVHLAARFGSAAGAPQDPAFFRTPLPDNAPLDPNSAGYAANLSKILNFTTANTVANAPVGSLPNMTGFAPPYCGPFMFARAPIFIVPADQSLVSLPLDFDHLAITQAFQLLCASPGVPIPDDVYVNFPNNDRIVVIYQPSVDTWWILAYLMKRIRSPRWWANPSNVSSALTGATGGSLPAGPISYLITAIKGSGDSAGETTCSLLASKVSSGAGGTNTKITLKGTTRWDSDGIRIYRRIGAAGQPWVRLITINPPSDHELGEFSWTWTDLGTATPEKVSPDPLHLPPTGDEIHNEDGTRQNNNAYTTEWRASIGGKIVGFSALDGPIRPTDAGGQSGSASYVPCTAGEITKADFQRGSIDHVLTCTFPTGLIHRTIFSYPALNCDGTSNDSFAVPYGGRFRLKPVSAGGPSIASLGIPSLLGNMVAQALQDYGLMNLEAGGALSLHCRSFQPDGGGWRPGEGAAGTTTWDSGPKDRFNPTRENIDLMQVLGHPTVRANLQLVEMGWAP